MEDKKAEISRIEIERAENGFVYKVCVDVGDGMEMHDYVYESIDDVLKAVKDDLESPHMRKYPSKEKMDKDFKEVHEDDPEVVGETRKNKGEKAAKRQLVAIALSKSRGGLFKK